VEYREGHIADNMSLRSTIQISRRLVQNGAAASKPLRSFSAMAQEPLISELSASYIELEEKYGAHNYHPLPVVLTRGVGEFLPAPPYLRFILRPLSRHNENVIAYRNTCVGCRR
jgi:hypothetical protein